MFRRQNKKGRRVDSISERKHEKVLSLKEKEHFTITINKRRAKNFLKRNIILGSILIIFISTVLVIGYASRTKAETATFYPSACLGGWAGSSNAAGKPEVTEAGNAAEFTTTNSAVLKNSVAQIFCSGFEGEIPEDTSPTRAILKLSWAYKTPSDEAAQNSIATSSEEDSYSNGLSPDDTSSTPAPDSEGSDPEIPDGPSDSEPPSVDPIVPVPPATEPETAPDSPPSDPSSDTSFHFWQRVHAQESEDVPEEDNAENIELDTVDIPAGLDAAPASSPTSLAEMTQHPDAILEVLYSTDGIIWQSLGTLSRAELSGASFEIPQNDFSNWKNLNGFQVSIQSVFNLDGPGAIYLDGVSLEVEYGKKPDMEPKLFNILNIQNSDQVILHVKEDDSNDDKLLISSSGNTLGSLAIYNKLEDFPILTTYVVDFSYVINASYFGPGDFTVLTNQDPARCDHLKISACRQSPDYIGEASFSIIKNETGTTTEATTTEATFMATSTESLENAATSSETTE